MSTSDYDEETVGEEEMMSYDISNDPTITDDTGFRCPILDAYSFRCLIDFMSATLVNLPISFTATKISALQADIHRTIFHRMYISTRKIADYYFCPNLEDMTIHVNMRQFKNKIKNAQKRTTTLTLFNKLSNTQSFYAVIVTLSSTGTVIIPAIRPEVQPDYSYSDYVDSKGKSLYPSLVVPVADLGRIFSQVSNSKCVYAKFVCYKRGIILRGMADGQETCVQTMGKVVNPFNSSPEMVESQNGKPICTYFIPNRNMKPFNKIANISPLNSTLEIYYSPDKPMKIVFPIGTSGKHCVFLASIDPTSHIDV